MNFRREFVLENATSGSLKVLEKSLNFNIVGTLISTGVLERFSSCVTPFYSSLSCSSSVSCLCVCEAKNILIFRHAVKCKRWLLFRVMWKSFPSVEMVPKALGSIPVVGRTFLSVTMNSTMYFFCYNIN